MPKKKMWVEWEDGADLSQSQKRPGDYSPLTRDGDKKLGHVTLSDVDEDDEALEGDWLSGFGTSDTDEHSSDPRAQEPSVIAQIIAEVVSHLIDAAIEEARPHVKRWWNDRVRPAIKSTKESTRNRFARTRKDGQPARGTEVVTFVDATAYDPSNDVEAAREVEWLKMSGDEAHQRLLAALVARAFSDEQIRILLKTQIEDADDYLASRSSMERFSPKEVENHVNLILEAHPSFLQEFAQLFLGERIGAGPLPLPRSDRLQEPLPPAGSEQ